MALINRFHFYLSEKQKKAIIQVNPKNVTTISGQDVTFECRYKGLPSQRPLVRVS